MVCNLRFVCGHANKAAGTLRRALANDTFAAIATEHKSPWDLRHRLVALLWLQGKAEGAASAAAPVLDALPEQVDRHAVRIAAARMAVAPSAEGRAAARSARVGRCQSLSSSNLVCNSQ